jgi:hypothetical protein
MGVKELMKHEKGILNLFENPMDIQIKAGNPNKTE